MRLTGGVVVSVSLAMAVGHGVQAFVPPACASARRTASAAAGTAHTNSIKEHNTCSAAEGLHPRRASMRAASDEDLSKCSNDSSTAADAAAAAEQRRKGEGQRRLRWAGVRRTLAHGAASFATFTFGATALSGLSAQVEHKLGGTVSMPAAMKSAQASIVKPFHKRTLEEKLGNIPAFLVTNSKGSPYLTPTEDPKEQLSVFFSNLDDAKELLREMAQSPTYAKEARILVVSMDKAYGMVKRGPMPTGQVEEGEVEEVMTFQFERDMHSIPKAKKLGLEMDPGAENVNMPVFYADGLQVKRDGHMVDPLFMDAADLVAAWKKAAAKNPDMPEKPVVKVFNLPEVMIAMEISDDLKSFGFFPSTEVSEYVRQGREEAKPLPKPRLGRMWSF